jgi:Arc/MetJ-type ribon-helix-helix transcriptional regulator
MATVTIRLSREALEEVDEHACKLHVSRSDYLRRAIHALNANTAAEHRRNRIMAASHRVRENSMRINAEFEAIEDAPDE